jgi:purine-binding chemotaxis protein CheW
VTQQKRTRIGIEPVVRWHLGDKSFAVHLDDVLEVVPVAELSEMAGSGTPHLGYLDLRGSTVPVFDARRLLGLPEREVALSDRFLVLRVGGGHAALLVDSVEGIAEVRPEPGSSLEHTAREGTRPARVVAPDAGALLQLMDLEPLLGKLV